MNEDILAKTMLIIVIGVLLYVVSYFGGLL
jgi:hypothetical protein